MKRNSRRFVFVLVLAILCSVVSPALAMSERELSTFEIMGGGKLTAHVLSDKFDQVALQTVNQERAARGAAPLTIDPKLNKAVAIRDQEESYQYMVENRMDHRRPNGAQPWGVSQEVDPDAFYTGLGEVITGFHSTGPIDEASVAQEAVSNFMNSKPHHDCLMDPEYTSIGIAAMYNPANNKIVCVMITGMQ